MQISWKLIIGMDSGVMMFQEFSTKHYQYCNTGVYEPLINDPSVEGGYYSLNIVYDPIKKHIGEKNCPSLLRF